MVKLQSIFNDQKTKNTLMAEWAWVLKHSSGVIVLSNAYQETTVIDEASKLYEDIILRKRRTKEVGKITLQQLEQMIEFGIRFKTM